VAVKKSPEFSFGGVDSRSNPTNFPPERLLRCRNFIITPAGQPRLRYGYTKPTQSGSPLGPGDSGGAVHSATYFEQFVSGLLGGSPAPPNQFLLFSAGTGIGAMNLATGVATPLGGPSFPGTTARWGHYFADNRVFMGNGVNSLNLSFDGTICRPLGIPGVSSLFQFATPSYLTGTPGNAGGWQQSILGGYAIYFVLLNPVTGHVSNRGAILNNLGNPIQVAVNDTNGGSLQITGLPTAAQLGLPGSGVDGAFSAYPELVLGVGRTNDNGQVPYWLVDGSGNRITIPLGQTSAVIKDFTIDPTQVLPFRNGQPPPLSGFAKVSTKYFGIVAGDVNLHYTEDDTDSTSGNFVGVPAESWAPDDIEPFPTAEVPTAAHAYRFEGYFFSKNALAVWSNLLYQQGSNPWRGPWPVGCAGQRACIETPYGLVWMTPDKELMISQGSDPSSISEEYEASLLTKIADQYASQTELAYYRNKELGIDRLYVLGWDVNHSPVFVIHDFLVKDFRSQVGQAYEYIYSGMVPNTFVGSGYTPRQNLRNTQGRERLWTGAIDGNFYQLEDGNSDNGQNYTGDAIFIRNMGDDLPMLISVQWQGDGNAQFSYSSKLSDSLAGFIPAETEKVKSPGNPNNLWKAKIGKGVHWIYGRFLLTSHPADGNFNITDPPFVPVPTYGLINMTTPKLGASQPLADE
jgi:hypothetical protein